MNMEYTIKTNDGVIFKLQADYRNDDGKLVKLYTMEQIKIDEVLTVLNEYSSNKVY